jgi:hypothetical protein
MLNHKNSPSVNSTYGRIYNRESELRRANNCCNTSNSCSVPELNRTEEANYENMRQTDFNNVLPDYDRNGAVSRPNIADTNSVNAYLNHYNRLKSNSPLRIKFVGFIYQNYNIILSVDERKVLYKTLNDKDNYRVLKTKVSVQSMYAINSYHVSFQLRMFDTARISASIELYPDIIDKVNITVLNESTLDKELIPEEDVVISFIDFNALLDDKGNLNTMNNYSSLFKMTKDDLDVLDKEYMTSMLYNFIHNVYSYKDFDKAGKYLLKELLEYYSNNEAEEFYVPSESVENNCLSPEYISNDCCTHLCSNGCSPYVPELPATSVASSDGYQKLPKIEDFVGEYVDGCTSKISIFMDGDYGYCIINNEKSVAPISISVVFDNKKKQPETVIEITFNDNILKFKYNYENNALVDIDHTNNIYERVITDDIQKTFSIYMTNQNVNHKIYDGFSTPTVTADDDGNLLIGIVLEKEVLDKYVSTNKLILAIKHEFSLLTRDFTHLKANFRIDFGTNTKININTIEDISDDNTVLVELPLREIVENDSKSVIVDGFCMYSTNKSVTELVSKFKVNISVTETSDADEGTNV